MGVARLPYNVAVAVAAGPVLLWKSLRDPAFARTVPERLGKPPVDIPRAPVWVHCASMGEVRSAARIVEKLASPFLISTMTPTGLALARRLFPDSLAMSAPLDVAPITRRVMRRIAPRLLIIVETEIWPELIFAAAARKIPVALVSARISDRTAGSYRRGRAIFGPALRAMAAIGAQTESDRARLLTVGADPRRVEITGNLKFDFPSVRAPDPTVEAIFSHAGSLFVAGSTHPGEDLAVLQAWRSARSVDPELRLVIAPRHLESIAALEELLEREGVDSVRRSRLSGPPAAGVEVIVLDTMGELDALYAYARVAFVGGSLAPVGGHNVLEPARYGKPVLFGPHTQNQRLETQRLLEAGGAIRVGDAIALGRALREILSTPERAAAMGDAGRGAIGLNQGAVERTLKLLAPHLQDHTAPAGRHAHA